jgi:hypothetical protein
VRNASAEAPAISDSEKSAVVATVANWNARSGAVREQQGQLGAMTPREQQGQLGAMTPALPMSESPTYIYIHRNGEVTK